MKLNNLFSSLKSKIIALFGKNKRLTNFILIAAALILVCIFIFPNKESSVESDQNSEISLNVSSKEYKDEIESKIKQMLLSIDEVNFASVMVVCDESEKYVYLKNITQTSSGSGESESKTITEEVVYEKSGSNSSPIIVSKIMPKVVGVWIVINSVSPSTKLDITNSVCSVLNIDKSSINILQGR